MNIVRPGISKATIARAGIRQIEAAEAEKLCGVKHDGLWIPYCAWGKATSLRNRHELGRLLVTTADGAMVGHGVPAIYNHAYLPPTLRQHQPTDDLFFCVGEFGALCLADCGLAAIGLPGHTALTPANQVMAPEIAEAMQHLQPGRILLVAHGEACLLHELSRAAVALRSTLGVSTLRLVRIPIHLPTDIGDVRALLDEGFTPAWDQWVTDAVEVTAQTRSEELAVVLATRELIGKLEGRPQIDAEERLVELAVDLDNYPLLQGRLLAFAVSDLRIPQFKQALKLEREKRQIESESRPDCPQVAPWPEPVDGANLLQEILDLITRYVVLPKDSAAVCAVWALHTWVFEAFDFTPLLYVDSPEKGCGKTTLRRVLSQVVSNPKLTSGVSEPSMFRSIDHHRVTLMVDEWDAHGPKERAMVTKILNAGVEPDGAVDRCVRGKVKSFTVFSPKALFGISNIGLVESTASRTIHLTLHRPLPGEKREEFKPRRHDSEPLRSRCARWAMDNRAAVEAADPEQPSWMRDRKAQVWSPLLAVADRAGGDWPKLIRHAAKTIAGRTEITWSRAQLAIMDALTVIERSGTDRMFSTDLVDGMIKLGKELNERLEGDLRPWQDGFKGRTGLTPHRLGDLLRPYGIEPQSIRQPENPQTRKGYYKSSFVTAYQQYVGPYPIQSGTPAQAEDKGGEE